LALCAMKLGKNVNIQPSSKLLTGGNLNAGVWRELAGIGNAQQAVTEEATQFYVSQITKSPLDQNRAQQVVQLGKALSKGEQGVDPEEIVKECEFILEQDPSNNAAFFVMSHAILARGLTNNNAQVQLLDEKLNGKKWNWKRPLYHYYFDYVDFINPVECPAVSIVVISNKYKEEILENLQSLKAQSKEYSEIIFVNNGASDAEFKELTPYIDVYIRLKKDSGACIGRNIGAVFSSAKIILYIDDDGFPEENLVNAHIETHNNYDVIAVRGVYWPKTTKEIPGHYYLGDSVKPASMILEGNTSFVSNIFFRVGGWSDYFQIYGEGTELSYRILDIEPDKTKQIYIPRAVLKHDHFRSPSHKSRKNIQLHNALYIRHFLHPQLHKEIGSWPQETLPKKSLSINHQEAIKEAKSKNKLKVVYLVHLLSMWKCDSVYNLMEQDELFDPLIFICPFINPRIKNWENMMLAILQQMNHAYDYFKKKGYTVVKSLDEKNGSWIDIRADINPDIIFFTRPWESTKKQYTIHNFKDKLTCYVPYGYITTINEKLYNKPTYRFVWKFFLETNEHKRIYLQYPSCEEKNAVVSGYPALDIYFSKKYTQSYIWKKQNVDKKKIVFALHWTTPIAQFFKLVDYIFKIADIYKDYLQICFKPHPVLKTQLFLDQNHQHKKILEYFNAFNNKINIQIYEENYVDIFLNSDALIHNCGSFIIEYLCMNKPVMFLAEDSYFLNEPLNNVAFQALQSHYYGHNYPEIDNFIKYIVIGQQDNLESKRLNFLNENIIQYKGELAAKNITDNLKSTIYYNDIL
ncbi:MAG: glycosyltransferase, partial [archaeon]